MFLCHLLNITSAHVLKITPGTKFSQRENEKINYSQDELRNLVGKCWNAIIRFILPERLPLCWASFGLLWTLVRTKRPNCGLHERGGLRPLTSELQSGSSLVWTPVAPLQAASILSMHYLLFWKRKFLNCWKKSAQEQRGFPNLQHKSEAEWIWLRCWAVSRKS